MNRRCVQLCALSLACASAGCATRWATDSTGPRMAPHELAGYYDYPREPIHTIVRDLRGNHQWTHKLVEFEFALPSELEDEFTRQARREAATDSLSRRGKDWSLA